MRKFVVFSGLLVFLYFAFSFTSSGIGGKHAVYRVHRISQPVIIDANWDKQQWNIVETIELLNYLGDKPAFIPSIKVRMIYDENNVYVIFQVKDRFVHCLTKTINGPVWNDSCVEFFFAPDTSFPQKYFNLEINCGGTPLMHYNIIPRKDVIKLESEDIKKVEIAHSLPQIVDPEIVEPVTWTIEYRIPLDILRKYSFVTKPKQGIIWRANFYKIADKTSNPHYITWSVVDSNKPDFHLPQFFGILKFE